MPTPLRNIDVVTLWNQGMAWTPGWTLARFRAQLVKDHDVSQADVVKVVQCADCSRVAVKGRGTHHEVANGRINVGRRLPTPGETRLVCSACQRYLYTCHGCRGQMRDLVEQPDGHRWCQTCLDENFFYCRPCGQHFPYGQEDDHRHADGCCESPARDFSMPLYGGAETLPAEERVLVSTDSGGVDSAGLAKIYSLLHDHAMSLGHVTHADKDSRQYRMWQLGNEFRRGLCPNAIGTEVQTKDGNFATRVKRYAYKTYGLKIEKDVLAKIGTIATEHGSGSEFWIEITRDLNRSATEFGHSGSCYWTEYNKSRCALKSNGAFGVRVFDSEHSKKVTGRCWVVPLRKDVDGMLKPTFSTKTGLWFVFNGYGRLAERGHVRLFSAMVGNLPYINVNFTTDGMYINAGSGYVVGDQATLDQQTARGGLRFALPQHSNLYEIEQKEMKAS